MHFATHAWAVSLVYTAATVLLLMAATFVTAVRLGRHNVIDVTWGLGFGAIALVSYFSSQHHESGTGRRLVLALLTVVWGVRLAQHIARRSVGEGEDPRYTAILDKAPGSRDVYALQRVYVSQAVLMFLISLPVQVAMFERGGLGVLGVVGIVVFAVGLFFESVGDLQLQRFRDEVANKGAVLNTGLWKYTRHPNYFGDATVWWGLSLIAFAHFPGILTVPAPLVMTFLLARGTGKPMLEKDIAQRRPAYADYLLATSGFLPLPPKKLAPAEKAAA